MSQVSSKSGLKQGIIDGLPLLGGYIPVAISFGVIAIQAGFSTLEATLISVFIYAGASQFLLVAMVASGAPCPCSMRRTSTPFSPTLVLRGCTS